MGGIMAAAAMGAGRLSVSVNPPVASGRGTSYSTAPVAAVVSGATGPITYAWSIVSSIPAATVVSPTSPSTSFQFADTLNECSGRAKVVVTSGGQTAEAFVDLSYLATSGTL